MIYIIYKIIKMINVNMNLMSCEFNIFKFIYIINPSKYKLIELPDLIYLDLFTCCNQINISLCFISSYKGNTELDMLLITILTFYNFIYEYMRFCSISIRQKNSLWVHQHVRLSSLIHYLCTQSSYKNSWKCLWECRTKCFKFLFMYTMIFSL